MKEISVIIPAYNEEGRILNAIKQVRSLFNKLGINHEIIVVDDGSTDNTAKEARKECNIKVVGYKRNKGKGYAIKYGSRFASKELITFLDADMEIDPKQISILLKYLKDSDGDIVIGSKRHPLSKIEYYPLMRKFLSKMYNNLLRLLFHIRVKDTQAGLKIIKREALQKILPHMRIKRFAFDVELLAYAYSFGYRVVEAPIVLNFSRRKWGRITLATIFNMFFDTMAIAYRFYVLKFYSRFMRDIILLLSSFLLIIFIYKQTINPFAFPGIEARTLIVLLTFCLLIIALNLPYGALARKFE